MANNGNVSLYIHDIDAFNALCEEVIFTYYKMHGKKLSKSETIYQSLLLMKQHLAGITDTEKQIAKYKPIHKRIARISS